MGRMTWKISRSQLVVVESARIRGERLMGACSHYVRGGLGVSKRA